MLAIAIAIWLEDRGPIFYRQVRMGLDGKPFASGVPGPVFRRMYPVFQGHKPAASRRG